jgi:hypothetical protein
MAGVPKLHENDVHISRSLLAEDFEQRFEMQTVVRKDLNETHQLVSPGSELSRAFTCL